MVKTILSKRSDGMLRAILAGRGPNTESADQIPVVTDKGSLMRADAANTNTFRGKRQDAQRELTRLLGAADARVLPEPSKTTISEYLRSWLDGTHGLSPQTTERYRELVELQIIPHLGNIALQKLTPQQIEKWHDVLLSWHPNWHRTARDSRGKHGKAQRQRSRKYGQKNALADTRVRSVFETGALNHSATIPAAVSSI